MRRPTRVSAAAEECQRVGCMPSRAVRRFLVFVPWSKGQVEFGLTRANLKGSLPLNFGVPP